MAQLFHSWLENEGGGGVVKNLTSKLKGRKYFRHRWTWRVEGLERSLSIKSLLIIYKFFLRPNLDYADIIYDKPLKESFKRKIEMVQYNTASAFKGISRDKIYQEVGLKSLADQR